MSRPTLLWLCLLTCACGSAPNRRVDAEAAAAAKGAQPARQATPRASDLIAEDPHEVPTDSSAAAVPESGAGAGAGAGAAQPSAAELAAGTRTAGQAGAKPESPAAVNAGAAAGPEAPGKAKADAPIAFIAGQPILASELLGRWMHREPRKVQSYLQEFVLERLVILEARRLEVKLERSAVEDAVARAVELIERQIKENGAGMDLETFVQRQYGLDPATYMRRLRDEQATDLLAERCVRSWVLENERAEVRIIAVRDEALMQEVQTKLAAGESFEELARLHSVDASAEDGGRLPPVIRAPGAPLSRLAFATPVGQVGGPINEDGTFMLVLVEARPERIRGDWPAVAAAVEASLAERGIEDPEYWQWKLAMAERYSIDTSPLLEFVGEPPTRSVPPSR